MRTLLHCTLCPAQPLLYKLVVLTPFTGVYYMCISAVEQNNNVLENVFNKTPFLKNCLGGLLARLIQVLDTTDGLTRFAW